MLSCRSCDAKFDTQEETRSHFKTEWHRYNQKRRSAGMQLVDEATFNAKVQAAEQSKRDMVSQNKVLKRIQTKSKRHAQREKAEAELQASLASADGLQSVPASTMAKVQAMPPKPVDEMSDKEFLEWKLATCRRLQKGESLFCDTNLPDDEALLDFMERKHSFKIPYREECSDVSGLLRLLGDKLSLANVCIWCGKSFSSFESVRQHIADAKHAMVKIEGNEDELAPFYMTRAGADGGAEWQDEGEWEEAGSDEGMEEDQEVIEYEYLPWESTNSSFVNDGGELEMVGPDGSTKVIGNRLLQRYYQQSHRPDAEEREHLRVINRIAIANGGAPTSRAGALITMPTALLDAIEKRKETVRQNKASRKQLQRNQLKLGLAGNKMFTCYTDNNPM